MPSSDQGGPDRVMNIVAVMDIREHGATWLVWQTASGNHRAQAVYERLGATREDRWVDYELPVAPV